jgi:hypothetical protein
VEKLGFGKCLICNSEFKLKKMKQRFCSIKCSWVDRKKGLVGSL